MVVNSDFPSSGRPGKVPNLPSRASRPKTEVPRTPLEKCETMRHSTTVLIVALSCGLSSLALAQNQRDALIRQDRELWSQVEAWNYEDLESARDRAANEQKPLMVVLRCVP